MSTALYILGFIVLIGGLAWAASLLGVPSIWITIGVVIVAGLAIIGIAGNLRGTGGTGPAAGGGTGTGRRDPGERAP